MISIETADNALKSFYLDAVTNALDYKANPFLAQIERSSTNVVGKDVKKLVRCNNMGGIVAGTETGDLPAAQDVKRLQFTAPLKNLYGTIEISDKALRASANNEGAFVNLLNDEMQTLIQSASYNFGRMIFGDGNGYLTKFAATPGTNSVILEDVSNIYVGMHVDICESNGSEIEPLTNLEVTNVNYLDNMVTFGNTSSLSAMSSSNCGVRIHGVANQELTGLKAIFDNYILYGVSKHEAPVMVPHVEANVGEITANKLQTALDKIEEKSGKGVNFIVCSWGVRRALVEHLSQNSIMMPTMECAGGFKAVSFNGIPVIADRFCPAGTMYLLNTEDFKIHQLCDWKWLEGEDGKILKQIPGKPVYTATLVKYAELMCEKPNGQGMLTGITEA